MAAVPLLTDIVVILGLSLGVVVLFHRLRVPPVIAFFLTGILAGPHGLALVDGVHEVEVLAEIGIVLLLFTIGMEFSLGSLRRMGRRFLLSGPLQVVATVAAVFLVAWGFADALGPPLVLGFAAALSSTAVVLKTLQQRGEVDALHGRLGVSVLLFQDLAVIPMMLLLPVMAGAAEAGPVSAARAVALAAAVLAGVAIAGRWLVPWVLHEVVRTRSRELFLLAVVTLGLGVAWLTAAAGLSVALGAFLAGLVVSESEYSHQAVSDMIPFRDVFTSFFFVSIGMLLDLGLVLDHAAALLGVSAAVIVGKAVLAGGIMLLLGFSTRTAVLGGVALAQVGEFSFILSQAAVEHGVIAEETHQWVIGTAVLTMAATPFLLVAAPALAAAIDRLPLPSAWRVEPFSTEEDAERSDHVVVIGFGLNGRNVARACGVAGVPYFAVEANPETVRRERARGEPILYGDATQAPVLEHAGVARARVLVAAISDPAATRRITAVARSLNPRLRIIARTRYLQETEDLLLAGADDVIPEELETSVEIVSRILAHYLVPRREIEAFVGEIRAGAYEMFRSLDIRATEGPDLRLGLPDVEVVTVRIDEGAPLVGRTLAESNLRPLYGVTVVAIRRGDVIEPNPGPAARVEAGDTLVLLGLPEEVVAAEELFRRPEGSGETS